MKMRYVLIAWFALLALMALAVRAEGAIPGWGRQTSAPHLSQIVRHLTRPGAIVYCSSRGPEGNAGEAIKATREIVLAPDICQALRQAPRVIEPTYPRSDTGDAVFTLAHEAGHLVRSTGENAESQADCYAAANWRRYARALGYTITPALTKQVVEGCWR